jgi:hypothetical protein
VSDRFVVASGETEEGSWQLSVYRARLSGTNREGWDEAGWWCFDLDAPGQDGSGRPATETSNICGMEGETTDELIGPLARYPDFQEGRSLIYGWTSREVAAVEIRASDGETRRPALVDPPKEIGLRVRFFAAFVSTERKVEILALDDQGVLLSSKQV